MVIGFFCWAIALSDTKLSIMKKSFFNAQKLSGKFTANCITITAPLIINNVVRVCIVYEKKAID